MSFLGLLSLSLLVLVSFQNCTPGFQAASGGGSSLISSISAPFVRAANSPVIGSANNIYSPTFIVEGGTLVMYFGGWLASGQINDNIYRSECHNGVGACDSPALIFDSAKLGFQALNDPTIVTMPGGYYLMYMTGLEKGCLVTKCNHVYYATSYDGVTWSPPQLIVSNLWLPAATIDGNGHVILYGNPTQDGSNYRQVTRYDMGTSGIGQISSTALNLPKPYANIDVQYRPSLGVYQMLAEVFQSTMNNQIDYLVSTDGINFVLIGDGIIKPQEANGYVRTPAASPTDESFIAYGETTDPGAEANQIYMVQLAPLPTAISQATPSPQNPSPSVSPTPTPAPAPQATPTPTPVPQPAPVVCVASATDQAFLIGAVPFFQGALATSAAAQAQQYLSELQANIQSLQNQGWPCAQTAPIVAEVQNQVSIIQQLAAAPPVQATPPPVQATPPPPAPPACVASVTDQEYLTTAVTFFSRASSTSEAAQAADCNAHLEAALSALQAQNWPCAATATTIQYVSTCVTIVSGQ